MLVQARNDLDEGGLARAVVAEHTGDLARVDLQGDPFEGADVPVELADVGQPDQCRVVVRRVVVHLLASARLRTHAFSRVARSSIAPRKNLNQSGFHWA
ncbi:hypothetical protein GCM10020000_16480 [Streptomyces olivoverticillatus]